MRPKPAGVYQKTSKGSYMPGLVGYEAEEDDRGMSDVRSIRHPHHDAPNSLQVLSEEGYSLRDLGEGMLGLRDEAQNFIYGDIDIHGVYKQEEGDSKATMIDASTFVPLFNERLIATGLHSPDLLEYGTVAREKDFGVQPWSPIQHGAHDEWDRRNDTTYAKGVNMGPLPGVIHFSPDPQMTPSYIGTTSLYQGELEGLGRDDIYTPEAWAKGNTR
jgi:insecticidal toxin complex protein TccC